MSTPRQAQLFFPTNLCHVFVNTVALLSQQPHIVPTWAPNPSCNYTHKNSEYFSQNLEIEHDCYECYEPVMNVLVRIYNDTVIQNQAFKLSETMYGRL